MEFNKAGQTVAIGCAGHGWVHVLPSLLMCYRPVLSGFLNFPTLFPSLPTLILSSPVLVLSLISLLSCTIPRCTSQYPTEHPSLLQAVTPSLCSWSRELLLLTYLGGETSGRQSCWISVTAWGGDSQGSLGTDIDQVTGSFPPSLFSTPLCWRKPAFNHRREQSEDVFYLHGPTGHKAGRL